MSLIIQLFNNNIFMINTKLNSAFFNYLILFGAVGNCESFYFIFRKIMPILTSLTFVCYYIDTSRNIARMTKQSRGHPRLNLNGYCGARVTQKFKWTQCKNQVVAHDRPWMTTARSRRILDRRPLYLRIAGSPIIAAGRNFARDGPGLAESRVVYRKST